MGDTDAYFSPSSLSHDASGEDPGSGGHSPGVLLGVRAMGDWTRALNEYALREEDVISPRSSTGSSYRDRVPVPVQVMFDGPYGGCALDLWDYERVLLVAGGSGATFAIGMLDELVAACCLSEGKAGVKTESVDFIWCIRSFGGSDPLFLVVLLISRFCG
jgi:ferric-chelate reductase